MIFAPGPIQTRLPNVGTPFSAAGNTPAERDLMADVAVVAHGHFADDDAAEMPDVLTLAMFARGSMRCPW